MLLDLVQWTGQKALRKIERSFKIMKTFTIVGIAVGVVCGLVGSYAGSYAPIWNSYAKQGDMNAGIIGEKAVAEQKGVNELNEKIAEQKKEDAKWQKISEERQAEDYAIFLSDQATTTVAEATSSIEVSQTTTASIQVSQEVVAEEIFPAANGNWAECLSLASDATQCDPSDR